jgi:large subunit ribosomal protein L10
VKKLKALNRFFVNKELNFTLYTTVFGGFLFPEEKYEEAQASAEQAHIMQKIMQKTKQVIKTKNTASLNEIKEKTSRAKSIVFAHYHGLKSNDVNALRAKMLESGADISVAKNTLFRKALQEANLGNEEAYKQLQGPTAAIFSYKDALAPLKPLVEFAKKLELPKITFAIIDGKVTSQADVKTLASLPSKEALISMLLSVFTAKQGDFVRALDAIAKKKGGEQ